MEGNTHNSVLLNYVSVTAISLVSETFKEQIPVLREAGRATQAHTYVLSHDPEHECAAPCKFREEEMEAGLRTLVRPRKTFASANKSHIKSSKDQNISNALVI